MEKHGIPGRDMYSLPTSDRTFPDGAQFRLEISGVERLSSLEALLDESSKRNVVVHRLISTVMGSTLLDKKELKDFAKLAAQAKVEIIITPGPRGLWDTGRQLATPEGALCGLRVRGSDNLSYLITDIKRSINAGFRGFLVWDEGVLWLLNEMRKAGEIPKETVFKVSIFAGHANAAGGRVLESLGANTFNPIADMSIPMLASIRRAVSIPMDLHVALFDAWGGFNRMYETPELARTCAPCYFKIEPGAGVGAMYKPWVSDDATAYFVREKVKFAQIIMEIMQEHAPELKTSKLGTKDLAIPRP
jgi:hypothetical protein